jgi:hypothetical protein
MHEYCKRKIKRINKRREKERLTLMATTKKTSSAVEGLRSSFKQLLLKNPNHFGNLAKSKFKSAVEIVADTAFEELTCVGFNPATNVLEATVAIKLPTGYGGDLCQPGSTEYIRFFVDYGGGWQDAGLAAINVHDIANGKDCADTPDKPLTYVASVTLQPQAECCNNPVLPKVHAILSWQWAPPAGSANVGWLPVWGNALDCQIQIAPSPWNLFCLLESIGEGISAKLKVPPLFEEVQYQPIPQPDPPPFKVSELAKLYAVKPGAAVAKTGKFSIEPHRFAYKDLQAILAPGSFSHEAASAKSAEFTALGIDWQAVLAALAETDANVSYEALECLGLDNNLSRVAATFRIKEPTGYSGDLCQAGSQEYVAFWADWDDTCVWTYLGTTAVNVHDISSIPKQGLCYTAILPVDLSSHLRDCGKPTIARLRAVLSWAVPPSTTDPDALNFWGNRIDAHVQIKPGQAPGDPYPAIWVLGGIPLSMINPFSGMTTPTAVYADTTLPPDALGRPCPFGLRVNVKGPTFPGFQYRIQVKRVSDPPAAWAAVTTPMTLERSDTSTYTKFKDTPDGYFNYVDFNQNVNSVLGLWDTQGLADDLWELKLDIKGIVGDVTRVIQLDNTAPTVDIHIDGLGDCKDFLIDSTITGTFSAQDTHFGSFTLSTLPNNPPVTPANNPTTAAPSTSPAVGAAWSLDTKNPSEMKPCGYVVLLEAVDRSILNSASQGNYNRTSVGLCLRAKKS